MALTVQDDLALPRDPTSAMHAVTKQYTDNLVQGLQHKAVRVATTGNITISTALNSGDAIDGVTLANGDRVLVKDQSAPAENGIYVVAASPGRATDFDTWAEIPGSLVIVEEGSTQSDTMWVSTANLGGTLNTTAVTFTQFRNATDLVAGGGIGLSGITLSVAAGTGLSQDADGLSINTAVVPRLGNSNTFTSPMEIDTAALGAGTPALRVDRDSGGAGQLQISVGGSSRGELKDSGAHFLILATTAAGDLVLDSTFGDIDASSNRVKNVSTPAAAGDATPRSFAARVVAGTVTGDGSTNPLVFTHNLNTTDIQVVVLDNATKTYELFTWVANGANTVQLYSAAAIPNTVVKRVIVQGIQN